jgi:hypothetical protein
MNDPATSLTDYAIAVECLILAVALLRFSWTEKIWSLAFISVSIATLLAGTFHGFGSALSIPHQVQLWQGMRLALVTASFFTLTAAAADCRRPWRRFWWAAAIGKLTVMLVWIRATWGFALAVVDYMSALVIVLLLAWRRSRPSQPHWRPSPEFLWMLGGLMISAIAALMLVIPWPLASNVPPAAAFHIIQIGALYCIYRSICIKAWRRIDSVKS